MPGIGEENTEERSSEENHTAIKILTPSGDLSSLTPDVVTNETIIFVTKAVTRKNSDLTWKDVATVMGQVYATHFPPTSIRTSFKDVEKAANRHRDLTKRQDYLQQIYSPPKVLGKRKMFSMTSVAEVDVEPKCHRTEPFEQVAMDLGTENADLRRTNERLTQEIHNLKQESAKIIDVQRSEIGSLKTKIERLKQWHSDELDRVIQSHRYEQDKLIQSHSDKLDELRLLHANKIDELRQLHTDELDELKQLQQAEKERLQHRFSTETERVKQLNTDLSKSLTVAKQKLERVYKIVGKVDQPKHVVQSFKRKNACVTKWRGESAKWKESLKKFQGCKSRIEAKSKKLKSLQNQNSNRKCRAQKKQIAKSKVDTNFLMESLEHTVAIVKQQNHDIQHVENALLVTEEKLLEAEQNHTLVPTRDPDNKGRIHPALKEASMRLQGIGVAENEVGPAIETVITTLTQSSLDGKLPSKSSQQRIGSEMRAVAKHQLKEVLSSETDMTLKYDGTTKNGRHIVEVELETKDSTYFVGGRETAGGKAKDYVETIVSVLDEVDSNMLNRVSNTMTDRVITNTAVDRELEKAKGGKLNSFRCAMHPLDSIHKQCDKFIAAHEHTLGLEKSGQFPYQKGGESVTQATLRSVDKLFHDSASGLPQDLPQFLKVKGIKGGQNGSLYPRWVGNRFNIYFVNAGLLYMYDALLREFQTKVIRPRNNLHHAVFNALSSGKLQPILRALGLVNKYLTGPWMAWQGTRQGILKTSQVFSDVLDTLDGIQASDLVCGFDRTAFGTEPDKDDKYHALTSSNSQDQETAAILSGLFAEITVIMRRQLDDHLPGGIYHMPDESLQKVAESCTMNNISGERVFAKIDSRINKAKSATLQKCMNKSQFTINKVPQYLSSKTKEERVEIIKAATTQARIDRIKERGWKEELQTALNKRLEESRQEIERKELNGREAKEKIIDSVLKHNLWETEAEVDDGVKALKKTPALAALKDQIRFRTVILGCTHPAGRKIAFSKSSQDESKQFLKDLLGVPIPENKTELVEIIKDPSAIVSLDFNQKWSVDGIDQMCRGSILRLVHPEKRNEAEYECSFDGETPTFQLISEIITDIAVGDMFLYIS